MIVALLRFLGAERLALLQLYLGFCVALGY